MAAPTTAYATEELNKTQGATTEQVQIAKQLAEYGTQAETREKFYLDEEMNLLSPTSQPHFIGGAYVGGTNINFHNPNRIVDLNIQKNGQVLALFDDAGLNTRGDIVLPGTFPNAICTAASIQNNAVIISAVLKAAYYLDSNVGVKIKSLGCQDPSNPAHYVENDYNVIPLPAVVDGILPQNTSVAYDSDELVIADPSYLGNYLLYAPNYYRIFLYNNNDELPLEVELSTFLAVPFSLSFKYSPTSFDAAANTLTAGTYWKNSASIGDKTALFFNQSATSVADKGFYVEPYSGQQLTYAIRVNANGYIDLETVYDWANQRTSWDYYSFVASSVSNTTLLNNAYNDAVNNNWQTQGQIYWSPIEKFYMFATGTTYASNGYYMIGMGFDETLETATWFRLLNGVVVESNNY